MDSTLDATTLAAIAGAALSFIFSYAPKASDEYIKLDGTQKRLVMAGMLILVGAAIFILGCTNISGFVTCDKAGAVGLVKIVGAALVANQAAFGISPETNKSKRARAARNITPLPPIDWGNRS